jgi:hypothetical protein
VCLNVYIFCKRTNRKVKKKGYSSPKNLANGRVKLFVIVSIVFKHFMSSSVVVVVVVVVVAVVEVVVVIAAAAGAII